MFRRENQYPDCGRGSILESAEDKRVEILGRRDDASQGVGRKEKVVPHVPDALIEEINGKQKAKL